MSIEAERKKQQLEVLEQLRRQRDQLNATIRKLERAVLQDTSLLYRDPRQLDLFDLMPREEA